ncbi:MAG: hypothetical protein AAGI71_15060 [Bacteroidota bacterium]
MSPVDTLDTLRARYLHLTCEVLPARAAEAGHWPVRHDHCFMRIVLDHVFEGAWYDHVSGRPAYRHLTADELRRAVALAEAIEAEGADRLRPMNRQSLRWRGKG